MDGRVRILCTSVITLFGSVGCIGMQTRPAEPATKPATTVKVSRESETAAEPASAKSATAQKNQQAVEPVQHQQVVETPPAPVPEPNNNQLPPPRQLPNGAVPRDIGPPPPLPRVLAAPTATGALLNLSPNESPIERAIELAQRLGTVEAEKAALIIRVQQLEAAIETRDRMLAESARDADQAIADVVAMRQSLQIMRQEMQTQMSQAKQNEKADVETMQSIRASLLKMLEPAAQKAGGS